MTKTTASAELRTRRTHTFQPGDLVIVQGVTGPDASLLNKQHTVGAVRASGSGAVSRTDAGVSRGDGNDIITFYPPLDLRGRSFDASQAVVGRANIGNECRAGAGKDGTKHGAAYCLFSADTRYHLPTTDSTLLDHTRYGQQLPGQPGHLGIGNTGRGATMGSYADEGGPVVTTRKEFQYNEERSEQYMDNVLAFEFTVEGVRTRRTVWTRTFNRPRTPVRCRRTRRISRRIWSTWGRTRWSSTPTAGPSSARAPTCSR